MLIQTLPLIASIVLGLTFLASSLSKLRDLQGFVLGVFDYQILPPRLAVIYGHILPIVEFACGLAMVLGLWPTTVGLLSVVLLMSFLVAVLINVARGRRLDCHCFGSRKSEPVGGVVLARLCVYLACGALVAVGRSGVRLTLGLLNTVPIVLLALSVLTGLYLLSAIPLLWRVWNTKPALGMTVHGGRISLRDRPYKPLVPSVDESTVAAIER